VSNTNDGCWYIAGGGGKKHSTCGAATITSRDGGHMSLGKQVRARGDGS
jgi:hypothetical protein